MSKTIHIFNPDTDYALATGVFSFTPSAKIKNVRKTFSLLPALWASRNDCILLYDDCDSNYSPLYLKNIIVEKDIKLLNFRNLKHLGENMDYLKDIKFFPWGWNFSLIEDLKKAGIPEASLPSFEYIEKIRNLSHRQRSIEFRNYLSDNGIGADEFSGIALYSENDIIDYIKKMGKAVLKAPWSSSGRGIIFSKNFTEPLLREWIRGILRKQGAIILEKEWEKILDFASEWECLNGKAIFKGVSIFETSSRGKYIRNYINSQKELLSIIQKNINDDLEKIIYHQKNILDILISPFYEGPLGIDMLSDKNKNINACVEINLRMTMGHVSIHAFNSGIYTL